METKAILKYMARSVTTLESVIETPQAGKESLKCTKQKMIAQCSVSAKYGSNLAGYGNKMVPKRIQASLSTFGKNLKPWAAWKPVELKQFTTTAVREWTTCENQDVKICRILHGMRYRKLRWSKSMRTNANRAEVVRNVS